MINDFPTIEIGAQAISLNDGDYLVVPQVYRQRTTAITAFYKKLFNDLEVFESSAVGVDPLGFNYVYYNKLCYVGLLLLNQKDIEPTKKMKLKYPQSIFNKEYIINHIKKDLKFRNYEEFVPIEIVTKNIHELRNLNSKITANIDDLLDVKSENEWEKKFEEANDNVKKIYVGSRLIKFILDNLKFYNHNYLETLKIDKSRSFTIHKSLLKIVKIFQNDFKKRKANISFLGNSYKTLKGDKELFEIILMLLIENSIKYSADFNAIPPKIVLNETNDKVEIMVSSWGTVVPDSERERIFSYGYRGTSNDENVTGTGMGLYNAKKNS